MRKFYVGDKVKVVVDEYPTKCPKGSICTVVGYDDDIVCVTIDYGDKFKWFFEDSWVELVTTEAKAEPKFKVGDKVVSRDPTVICSPFKGVVGTIIKVYDEASYEIEYPCGTTQVGYLEGDSLELVTTEAKAERKFKLGDKVRVTKDEYPYCCPKGSICTVVNLNATYYIGVTLDSDDYVWNFKSDWLELVTAQDTPKAFDPVSKPSHYNQYGIESDGGPSAYYDFEPTWKTWNDFADYKSKAQWKEHSFHLGNVGKSICRWGDKGGTTKAYDARKIVYSGLRVLMMLEGKDAVTKYLEALLNDQQFKQENEND